MQSLISMSQGVQPLDEFQGSLEFHGYGPKSSTALNKPIDMI
jgi:hypothetical protein